MNIESLLKLSKRKNKYVIGLMSGTSVDGVDVVLIEINGSGINTKIKQLGFITYPFPRKMKEMILRNAELNGGNVTDICKLNFLIARVYVSAIKSLCDKIKFPLNKVHLIGSHGQTIHHLPKKEKLFGYNTSSTLQIGDPGVIAKLTKIITVGDFRVGDVALGGEGAPLVPYFDYIIFHSTKKNYDKDGRIAKRGKINLTVLEFLKQNDPFIERNPPKSTGREYYGNKFLTSLLKKFKKIPHEDMIRTVTMFTAYGVYRNYEKFIMNETKIDELFLSGGGARNLQLIEDFKDYFS